MSIDNGICAMICENEIYQEDHVKKETYGELKFHAVTNLQKNMECEIKDEADTYCTQNMMKTHFDKSVNHAKNSFHESVEEKLISICDEVKVIDIELEDLQIRDDKEDERDFYQPRIITRSALIEDAARKPVEKAKRTRKPFKGSQIKELRVQTY